jgi:DNA mismatch repair protein MutL
VVIEAGITVVSRTTGAPEGSRVAVGRLFFNTPARLKFLKQKATENAVIARLVSDLALGNPSIAIRLEVDGRLVLETPGTGDLRATFAAIYDGETAAAMLPVDEPAVTGLISPPALHRGTRDHLVILVNGRRIQHRNLAFAVEQAYRGLREPDRFPLAVLNLQIEPSDVDVNVHPTKREVRFRSEGAVFGMVERACYRALRQSPLYEIQSSREGLELRDTAFTSFQDPLPPHTVEEGLALAQEAISSREMLPPLEYVGQLLHGYLVAEAPNAAVLVDQHAAHERVLFDRVMRRLEQRGAVSQPLLMPLLLDLTPAQLTAFQQQQGWLSTLGFEADPFGPHTIRLLAAPVDMPQARAARVLELLLADLAAERSPDRRLRDTAALMACHSAVRFGDAVTPEAARELLSSLALTDEPISCPHGRPTTLMLPDDQLRRLFKRP